jgi:hypothetical protein
MGHADIAAPAVSAAEPRGKCPFHADAPPDSSSKQLFEDWLGNGLYCSAGKREFKLDRYSVVRFRNGREYGAALEKFREDVAAYRKTGFLALHADDASRCSEAADELRLLAEVMFDAGLTDDVEAILSGSPIAVPIEVACPVTGKPTIYEFFPVAFCRGSSNPADPLYDPSLGAPFTAINTTSDAFAFAMLVRDQAIRAWGKAPHEMDDRDAVELLFRKCVTVWQNMSINTIQTYEKTSVDPARGVHLSNDRKRWIAPHNDPVFAELKKCPHSHEMPVSYATRLAAKWSANLFDGKEYVPSRDGQSGGVPVFEVEGVPDELYKF